MRYSTCCGAATWDWEYGICPDCKDHTEFITEKEYYEDEVPDDEERPNRQDMIDAQLEEINWRIL